MSWRAKRAFATRVGGSGGVGQCLAVFIASRTCWRCGNGLAKGGRKFLTLGRGLTIVYSDEREEKPSRVSLSSTPHHPARWSLIRAQKQQ